MDGLEIYRRYFAIHENDTLYFTVYTPESANPIAGFGTFQDAQAFILERFKSKTKGVYQSDCYYWSTGTGDFEHYDARISVWVQADFGASPDSTPSISKRGFYEELTV